DAPADGTGLSARGFRDVRAVLGRCYKLIVVDTGNDSTAPNWRAAIDATDQLVLAMSASTESAEAAAEMLGQLEQTDRHELVRRGVAGVTLSPQPQLNPRAIERYFADRCRTVLPVPSDRALATDGPVQYAAVAGASRRAWLTVAAAVADGL